MPYTIKPGSFKYKKSNGQFSEIDCFEGPDLTEEVAALEKGKSPIIIDSATGNPIVIKDGADGLPIEGMKIHFSPVQSGTGDPSPSNIRPISGWNSFILNRTGANVFNANEWIGMGVNSTKYSIGENCTITVKESDTSGIGNRLITLIPNIVYAYYVDNNFSDIRVFNSSGSSIESKSTQTFTAPSDGKVAIKFYASTYPTTGQFSMVIGSIPPVACIPYVKNYNLITVPALGKNLCPKLIKGIGINADDGSEMQIATFATTDYIPVDFSKDHEYSLSGLEIQLTSYIAAYNAQKQFVGRTSGTQRANDHLNETSFLNGTDKATGDIAFLRIVQYEGTTNKSIDLIDSINVQLEAGSSVTTYEPYINNTIYGGTLDAVNGVLTVTHAMWKKNTADMNTTNADYPGWIECGIKDIVGDDINGYVYTLATRFLNCGNVVSIGTRNGNDNLYLPKSQYDMTKEEWVALAIDVQFVAPLATPYEIQLDPVTVTTLLGDNTIWSDANGDIELDYRADTKLFCQKNDQVNDVQINGTSILDAQGVANVPYANSSTPGVIQIGSGLYTTGGKTGVNYAGTSQIQGGTANAAMPVSRQHISTFYGLAKAAGADMASSSNPVGQFTPEAIVAIQKMLGVYEPPFELIRDITLEERTSLNITVDNDGLPLNLLSLYMEILYPANAESETTGYGRYYFYDSNSVGACLYAETSKFLTNTSSTYKLIEVSTKANRKIIRYTTQSTVGYHSAWVTKAVGTADGRGMMLNYGNITRIIMNSNDYEPVGTRIRIWGQKAY